MGYNNDLRDVQKSVLFENHIGTYNYMVGIICTNEILFYVTFYTIVLKIKSSHAR